MSDEPSICDNLSTGKCFGVVFNPFRAEYGIYMREISKTQRGARLGTNTYPQLLTAPDLPIVTHPIQAKL